MLRFSVGDIVEANCGTGAIHVCGRRYRDATPCPRSYPCPWDKGRIAALWDDGDPYRIMLDSGVEIWASADVDDCVRPWRPATSWPNAMVWESPCGRPAANSALRFCVDETVEVKVSTGHWKACRIAGVWDDGCPYRVMFDGGFIGRAAVDSDEFVRAG